MAFRFAKKAGKWSAVGAATMLPPMAYEAYKYRARSSLDADFHERMRGVDRLPTNRVEKFFYNMAMNFTSGCVSTLFWCLTHGAHDVEILDHDKLLKYVDADRGGVPLITIANHQSTLDDPMFQSALMPASVRWDASRRMRWGVCTEEICFASPGIASFMSMGKALPIQRGGSIHQKAMATLQAKLNGGDWVHVYPEARVWQEDGTPLRDEQGRWCSASGRCGPPGQKVGPFKWGVGKLIANASVTPVVVPYFHQGMAYVRPQKQDNDYSDGGPVFNVRKRLTVKFGDPIDVRDLLESYHADARQRALTRNAQRERELADALRDADKRAAKAAAAGAGWGSYLAIWRHIPGLNAVFGASGKVAAPPSPAAQQFVPAAPARVGLTPVNTIEEASDHSGASAHVAGLAVPMPAKLALEAEQWEREAAQAQLGSFSGAFEAGMRSAAELERELEAKAREARALLERRAHEVEQAALEKKHALEARAKETAEAIETRARELQATLRRLQDAMRQHERAAPHKDAQTMATDFKHAKDDAEAAASGPVARPPAPHLVPQQVCETHTSLRDAVADLQRRWSNSISVPPPARVPVPLDSATGLPAAIPAAQDALATRAQAAQDSIALPSGGAFPLSDEPVVEIVPTRKLRTGAVVPTYIEAPLRVKPPDHLYLNPSEAAQEEDLRLQLYSRIAARLQDAVAALERDVMTHRRAKGIVEERPMR